MKTSPAYFQFTDTDGSNLFVIELRDAEKIAFARKILTGDEKSRVHLHGQVVKTPAPYNPGWSYHLEPDSIDFFEIATEVCDSSICLVEKNLADVGGAFLPGNHWCPWSSRLVGEVKQSSFPAPPFSGEFFNLTDEFILVGEGGGFTQRFTDFAIGSMGQTSLISYIADYPNGDPIDVAVAPLLHNNRADEYQRLLKMAVDLDFFSIRMDSVMSETVRHTAVSHPTLGSNSLAWVADSTPPPPEALVDFDREIRKFLETGFREEFGPR